MEFKIKRFIIILLVLLTSQLLFSENPQIINSPNRPIHGDLHLKLKKDLILGEEAQGPYFFASVNGIDISDKYIIKGHITDETVAKHYTGPRRVLFYTEGIPMVKKLIWRQ